MMSFLHFTLPKITLQVEAVNLAKFLKWKLGTFSSILHVFGEDHSSVYIDNTAGVLALLSARWEGSLRKELSVKDIYFFLFSAISEVKHMPRSGQHILTTLNKHLLFYMHVIYYFFIISDTACTSYMRHKGKHMYLERTLPRQNVSQILYSVHKATYLFLLE